MSRKRYTMQELATMVDDTSIEETIFGVKPSNISNSKLAKLWKKLHELDVEYNEILSQIEEALSPYYSTDPDDPDVGDDEELEDDEEFDMSEDEVHNGDEDWDLSPEEDGDLDFDDDEDDEFDDEDLDDEEDEEEDE